MLRNGDRLLTADGSNSYQFADGVPDLRLAPARLHIDAPWYEPWDDLDSVMLEAPDPYTGSDVPPRLDKFQAAAILAGSGERWVLEVGCGEKWNKPWLGSRGFEYVGMDIDSRGPGPDLLGDAHNLPIADGAFDLVISFAALEHVVSPITVMSEIKRVLRPGGRFVGSAAFMYGFHDRASFFHMSHAGLLYSLRIAGFAVERMWCDWPYAASISQWGFRGPTGALWRWASRTMLWSSEQSFVALSNLARRTVGKKLIDKPRRAVEMAGSISFVARRAR
ncbi:MAG: class I SAM-dependent methyltransferase [Pseudomonadales bacterium]|nr:class I SAM-dependent methyltransferase [Pseudomonadales bacterium]